MDKLKLDMNKNYTMEKLKNIGYKKTQRYNINLEDKLKNMNEDEIKQLLSQYIECKRYYNYYKNLDKVKYFIFLDIDDECYDKLKKQTGYMNDDIDEFNFSENYRLATFKNNILYILKELTSNIHSTDNNLVGVLNQYINLLNEKYYLMNENETRLCLDIYSIFNLFNFSLISNKQLDKLT